jgi:hypothetical protein
VSPMGYGSTGLNNNDENDHEGILERIMEGNLNAIRETAAKQHSMIDEPETGSRPIRMAKIRH